MFGVALLANRHDDLRLKSLRIPPKMVHHDMDAPPWWHFRLKHHLYIDGFAPKGHRALMQFILVEQNGPDAFRSWEDRYGLAGPIAYSCVHLAHHLGLGKACPAMPSRNTKSHASTNTQP